MNSTNINITNVSSIINTINTNKINIIVITNANTNTNIHIHINMNMLILEIPKLLLLLLVLLLLCNYEFSGPRFFDVYCFVDVGERWPKGLKGVYKKESFEGATISINRGGLRPPNPPRGEGCDPPRPPLCFLKLNTRAVEFETSILPQNFYCYYYY